MLFDDPASFSALVLKQVPRAGGDGVNPALTEALPWRRKSAVTLVHEVERQSGKLLKAAI